jgi:hypothetical protein
MDCGDVVKGERLEVFFFAVCLVALIILRSFPFMGALRELSESLDDGQGQTLGYEPSGQGSELFA